jgi:peptide/nickel transport system substrate-binding protein
MAAMDLHNWKTLILLLQDNLARADIKLDVDFTTWPVLFQKLQKPAGEKPFGMAAYQMWAAIPDPVDILMWWHTRAITVINPGWGTPQTDQWIDDAGSTPDHEKRVALYKQVVEKIAEDAPGVWIAQPLNVMVYQKWLKGYEYVPYYNGLHSWYDLYVEGKPAS